MAVERLLLETGDYLLLESGGGDKLLLESSTAGGAYTLTCDAATFTLAAQDASLLVGYKLTADTAAYVLAAQDATLTYTPIVPGSYTLTGDAAAYVLAGQDASLLLSRVIAAEAGAYAVTAQDATLTYSGATPPVSPGGFSGGGGGGGLVNKSRRELHQLLDRAFAKQEDPETIAETLLPAAPDPEQVAAVLRAVIKHTVDAPTRKIQQQAARLVAELKQRKADLEEEEAVVMLLLS